MMRIRIPETSSSPVHIRLRETSSKLGRHKADESPRCSRVANIGPVQNAVGCSREQGFQVRKESLMTTSNLADTCLDQ